jgi:mRNA interferase MazF
MKQFDIYLVNLDPTVGSEIKKSRPAIIVSPDVMNKMLNTVIIAPLTTAQKGYPSRVNALTNGKKGEVVLDQIRAVDKTRLSKKMGKVDANTAKNIKLVLQTMFS